MFTTSRSDHSTQYILDQKICSSNSAYLLLIFPVCKYLQETLATEIYLMFERSCVYKSFELMIYLCCSLGRKIWKRTCFWGNDEFHAFLQFLDLHKNSLKRKICPGCCVTPEISAWTISAICAESIRKALCSLSAAVPGDYLQWLKFCDAELHGWLAFLLRGNLEEIQR